MTDTLTARPVLPGGPLMAVGNAIFGDLTGADLDLVAKLGFAGLEPYRQWLGRYLDEPRRLREELEARELTLATCSNGGAGQSMDFIDPKSRALTIADHLDFARRFLSVFGCRHFKINLGVRPPGGTTEDDLQAIAETLNELGRLLGAEGIRLAPHPHIWGPVERPREIVRLLELTDPAYVSLTLDTAQVLLGGGDPLAILDTYWDRVVALHWKDAAGRYRDHRGPTPTLAEHEREFLYKDLGAGGVDFPAVWRTMVARGYRYWITLDLDPPAPGEGSVEDKLRRNRAYLEDELKYEMRRAPQEGPR